MEPDALIVVSVFVPVIPAPVKSIDEGPVRSKVKAEALLRKLKLSVSKSADESVGVKLSAVLLSKLATVVLLGVPLFQFAEFVITLLVAPVHVVSAWEISGKRSAERKTSFFMVDFMACPKRDNIL